MNIKQKELVLLPYPFSDQEGSKVRPAIVVSNDNFNEKSEDSIMVPLTTMIRECPYSILINQEDLSSGKLIKQSQVRADKIFAIHKYLVMMKIGVLKEETFEKIKSELAKIF